MIEAYTLLSAIAQHTNTVRLSALVTGNTYRHPTLLAKTITALDHVSNGRATLGIGAGWFELSTSRWATSSARSPTASRSWKRPCRSSSRCCAASG